MRLVPDFRLVTLQPVTFCFRLQVGYRLLHAGQGEKETPNPSYWFDAGGAALVEPVDGGA